MNRLSFKERARILACLVEGSSMRATQRMTGFAKKTVERALREIGEGCVNLLGCGRCRVRLARHRLRSAR